MSHTVAYPSRTSDSTSGRAVGALVLGILSLGFGFVLGLPAVLLGIVAAREVDASDGALTGSRMARTGVVLGAIGTSVGIALTVVLLVS